MVVGDLAFQLDCSEGVPPPVGALFVMVIFGQRSTFEVVRVSAYRHPQPMGSGWATHFVRLVERSGYYEE